MLQRYFLPKITQTSAARHALRDHHISLLRNLTTSLASLKEAQAENLTILPKTDKFKEPSHFSACHSLKAVLKEVEERNLEIPDIHPMILLRCGIEEFAVGKEGDLAKATTEDLFRLMESHVTWLLTDEGVQYEVGFVFQQTYPSNHSLCRLSISSGKHSLHFLYSNLSLSNPKRPKTLEFCDGHMSHPHLRAHRLSSNHWRNFRQLYPRTARRVRTPCNIRCRLALI